MTDYDNAPPVVTKFQEQVVDGSNITYVYQYQNGGGTKTVGDIAFGEEAVIFNDPDSVYSYARIQLSTSGTRTVEFSTTHNTKAQKYTIRVEETTAHPMHLATSRETRLM